MGNQPLQHIRVSIKQLDYEHEISQHEGKLEGLNASQNENWDCKEVLLI